MQHTCLLLAELFCCVGLVSFLRLPALRELQPHWLTGRSLKHQFTYLLVSKLVTGFYCICCASFTCGHIDEKLIRIHSFSGLLVWLCKSRTLCHKAGEALFVLHVLFN